MRAAAGVILGCVIGVASCIAPAAHAADGPTIVIPGRLGAPIINGVDTSYAIIEGDFGLDRPGSVPLTIFRPRAIARAPRHQDSPAYDDPRRYLPADGRDPAYGRLEVIPPANRRKPRQAESYHREWWSGSQQQPATIDQPGNTNIHVEPQVDFWGKPRQRPPR